MTQLPADASPPFDFWDYVERIPVEDFRGWDNNVRTVHQAYEEASRRYVFVNIDTNDKNVFMVVVLDTHENRVHGHFLLDLNEEYGLKGTTE